MIVFIVTVWAVLATYTPLVLSVWIIHYLWRFVFVESWQLIGSLSVDIDGTVYVDGVKEKVCSSFQLYKPLVMCIRTDNKRNLFIWRDACSDADYRQLSLLLNYVNRQSDSDLPL